MTIKGEGLKLHVSRPIEATLMLKTKDEMWSATEEDLRLMGFVRSLHAYGRFSDWVYEHMKRLGIEGDITDTKASAARYAIECALMYDHMPDDDVADELLLGIDDGLDEG